MKLTLLITFLLLSQILCLSSTTTRTYFAKKRHTNSDPPDVYRRPYNLFEQIEYRLMSLEVKTIEKIDNVLSELRESNRKLEELQRHNTELRSSLELIRTDFAKITERIGQSAPTEKQSTLDSIEHQLAYLSKGTQLLVASVRNIGNDITSIRKNMSHVADVTSLQMMNDASLSEKNNYRQKYEVHDSPACNNKSMLMPKSCKSLQKDGVGSGIYHVHPSGNALKPFMVMCDMSIKGGGWTYIHNRYDGTQDFYLSWHDYKHGFGNLAGEFWLGLDYIHALTGNEVNELLVELIDAEGETRYAHYSAFSVGSASEGFALKVLGGYEGDAGDALMYHAGSRFSTKDVDQDGWVEGSCAQSHGGAWWYRSCDTSNLNGKYFGAGELPDQYLYNGMYWNTFNGPKYNLLQARMLIRPRDEHSSSIMSPDRVKVN